MEDVITATFRLLKVLMLCAGVHGSHEYRVALTLHLLLLVWLKQTDHPVWRMLVADPNVINEERGELAFAVLARGLASYPGRSDIDRVRTMFMMTKNQIDLCKDIVEDVYGDDDDEHWKQRVRHESQDYATVLAHFKNVVRQMKAGTWRHYSLDKKITKFTDAAHAREHLVTPSDVNVWYIPRVHDEWVELCISKTVNQTQTRWMEKFTALWPEVRSLDADEVDDDAKHSDPGSTIDLTGEDREYFGDIKQVFGGSPAGVKEKPMRDPAQSRKRGLELASAARLAMSKEKAFEERCVPEQIVNEQMIRGQKQYFIKWLGFPTPSWDIAHQFDDDSAYEDLVADWTERKNAQTQSASKKKSRKKRKR